MLSFEISQLLEWAWAILQFTLDYVWIFCALIMTYILISTVLEQFKKGTERLPGAINKIFRKFKRPSS